MKITLVKTRSNRGQVCITEEKEKENHNPKDKALKP